MLRFRGGMLKIRYGARGFLLRKLLRCGAEICRNIRSRFLQIAYNLPGQFNPLLVASYPVKIRPHMLFRLRQLRFERPNAAFDIAFSNPGKLVILFVW